MKTVAVLGLGTMGSGMARSIANAGFPLIVWNRSLAPCAAFAERGTRVASTPAEAAARADVVLYCLPHADAVDTVVFGPNGVLSADTPPNVAIDLSTVHPDTSRKQADAYAEQDVGFLDAPVFGSRSEADSGSLWVVVGGAADTLADARPVLEAISQAIHHMGAEPGAGAAMKLCGNLLVASMFEALAESLVLGTASGLDPTDMLNVLDTVDFRSPLFKGVGTSMLNRSFDDPSFALRWMWKDATLIQQLAADYDLPVPAADAAASMLHAAVDDGHGDADASALIRALEARTSIRLDGPPAQTSESDDETPTQS
mgnify:CR=1 FL=1